LGVAFIGLKASVPLASIRHDGIGCVGVDILLCLVPGVIRADKLAAYLRSQMSERREV